MKKILVLAAVAISTFSPAQLIDKNDIIIQAGAGLGIYHFRFTDMTNNVIGERDTSAAIVYPIQVEYGVNRWFGLGLNYTHHNFIEKDSLDERAMIMDIGLVANFHVPWQLKKFDLTGHIGYAFSRFKYTVAEWDNWEMTATGTVLFFGINPRLYFKEDGHLGISAWYRYTLHAFNSGEVTDNSGFVYEFKADGPGNIFGLGLFYRI